MPSQRSRAPRPSRTRKDLQVPSRADSGYPQAPEAPFTPGQIVAKHYEIRSVLGEGGMGLVYEAHDRALNRRVAIKVGRENTNKSFLRAEAQALAAIRHPCLTTVYAFTEEGRYELIIMELIRGTSLRRHMEQRRRARQPFTVEETLDLAAAVAEGLSVVHRAGVAHRDVKPSNIMLAPRNRVVVLDFGLFRAECAPGETEPVGSPEYMAPEVILGKLDSGSGHLCDVYGLGIVLFEMLVGTVPFEAAATRDVLQKHLNEPVPDLRRLRPEVPPALAELVSDMLAKAPKDRPQSAEVVAWQARAIRAQPNRALSSRPPEAVRVVVVESDPDTAELVTLYLRRAARGATVRVADDGDHALRLVRSGAPTAVLVGTGLQGMSAVDFVTYLRSTGAVDDACIILYGDAATAPDADFLQELGRTRFVPTGPSMAEGLLAAVRSMRTS